jgi:thiamine-monophosphate kinase
MTRPSESGLIAALLARVPHRTGNTGPGDDAAVLPPARGERVITTDALIEGTHFLRTHPPEALGYKALAVNLSDVAAMGATPEAFLISAALPTLPDGWWEAFCEGLGACARESGVVVAGGDTVRSLGPVALTITAWGVARNLLERSAGQPGDTLMVVGPIGRSGVGFDRWLAHQVVDDDPCLMHHLRPSPPLWAGPLAADLGVRCGMDLSDGLATDLPRLAVASGLAIEVELDALPADPALTAGPIQRAQSGEDYGLVTLVPPRLVAELAARGFSAIGRAATPGARAPGVIWRLAGVELGPLTPTFGHFSGDSGQET